MAHRSVRCVCPYILFDILAAQGEYLSRTEVILSKEHEGERVKQTTKVVYNNINIILLLTIYSIVFVERVTAVSRRYMSYYSVYESACEREAKFCTV